MKIFHLVSILLATVSARNSPLSLYAKINGDLTPITKVSLFQFDYLVVKETHLTIPQFTLDTGTLSTEEGRYKKVFGISDDYLVLGKKSTMIQLNEHSKLLNIQPYLCKRFDSTSFNGILMSKDYSSGLLSCSQIDIFILSPEDASNQSGCDDIEKQEIKQESEKDKEPKHSSIGSESSGFGKHKEARLHSRASVADSRKAEARRGGARNSPIISLISIFGL